MLLDAVAPIRIRFNVLAFEGNNNIIICICGLWVYP